MKTRKMKLSDINQGPIRQQILPEGFIARVLKYKEILKEVECCSLEETVSNFQRDLNPERELVIWEKIADFYKTFIKDKPELSISDKKKIFGEILTATF